MLSLMPSPPSLDVREGDKLQHVAAYLALMACFCLAHAGRTARLAHAAGFIAMGIALEFAQGATGYRSFDVADMAANTVGVLLGAGVGAALARSWLP